MYDLENLELGPTIHELAGAEYQIGAMAEEIEKWKKDAPEGKHMVVSMRVPDGRSMLVAQVRPLAHGTYVATGFIDELPCMVTGHISTLVLFCAYEEKRGRSQAAGFTVATTIRPPQESSRKATGKSKPPRKR
jgi:hypothetical protein